MALVRGYIGFDVPVPDWVQVASKISELTGLSVQVIPDERGEDKWHQNRAKFLFECDPHAPIEISYGPINFVGDKDPERIYVALGSWSHLEPTLFVATEIALTSLGGQPRSDISKEDRAYYTSRMTPADLEERKRKYWWRNLPAATFETIFGGCCVLFMLGMIGVGYSIWFAVKGLTWLVMHAVAISGRIYHSLRFRT